MFLSVGNVPVLISNRDENPYRQKAVKPEFHFLNGIKFLCPIDPVGNGTWVGLNEYGTSIILLNGAFYNHSRSANGYRKSRGTIVYDLLGSHNPVQEWVDYNLEYIEPFTLIVFTGKRLFELVWDGNAKHQISYPFDAPAIWSSSTLYSTEAKKLKREFFFDLLRKGIHSSDELIEKLQSYKDDQDGFFINRSATLRTLSTTVIELRESVSNLDYIDHDLKCRIPGLIQIERHFRISNIN
jgi:uncharacterized protein with NRDE domain